MIVTSSTIRFMTARTLRGSTVLSQSRASTLLRSNRDKSPDSTHTYLISITDIRALEAQPLRPGYTVLSQSRASTPLRGNKDIGQVPVIHAQISNINSIAYCTEGTTSQVAPLCSASPGPLCSHAATRRSLRPCAATWTLDKSPDSTQRD